MIVRVDLTTVPPTVVVSEQDDFKALKAVVVLPEHTWIDQDVLRAAVGGSDPESFEQKYSAMVGYAAGQGWVDDAGRVRAHLEVTTSTDSAAHDN